MTDFKKGDIVVLKSGGPTMTVSHVADERAEGFSITVTCRWFDQKGGLQTSGFDPETIEKND